MKYSNFPEKSRLFPPKQCLIPLSVDRSIFADEDDEEDDNVADTLGISTKPVVNGEPVKKQTPNDEVCQYLPLVIVIVCVLVTWASHMLV